MDGSIRQRGNTWSYRIDLGLVNGKRKQKEKGGFENRPKAKLAMQLAIAELIKTGEVKENKNITLSEIYEEFILYEAPITRKHSTIVRYQSLYKNHIMDKMGNKKIGSITSIELQKFISDKMKVENLSSEYVKSIYNFLLVLFGYAFKKDYLIKNIINDVSPPKSSRNMEDISIYTSKELQILHDRLETTNLKTAFMLGLHLGLRAGEVYALRWQDIDFENNTVNVNKQLQNYNKKWCFTTLKTDNSYRKIKFDNILKDYLLNIQKLQPQHKDFYGPQYKANIIIDTIAVPNIAITVNDLINVKENGEMLNTNSHKIIARIAKSEFDIDFKFHNLRHTHATILLEKGVNPKYISQRLGHSKLEFTLRLYTHITRSMDDSAIDALNFSLNFVGSGQ